MQIEELLRKLNSMTARQCKDVIKQLCKERRDLRVALQDCVNAFGGCARPYSKEPCGSCVVCRGRKVLEQGERK